MQRIYLHGLGQRAESWEKVTEKLEISEHAICLNLAELVHDQEASYQNLYAAFSAKCDSIKEEISLCGLSLGGVLALNYAIDYPEKVKDLVLIAAQYKMPRKRLKAQNVIFQFLPKFVFPQMGFSKSDFIKLCSTMMELDFSDYVYRITCPVLVICGEKDSANKSASIKLANMLTNAEFQVLGRTGHEVNIEAPDELAKMLQSFYDRISE